MVMLPRETQASYLAISVAALYSSYFRRRVLLVSARVRYLLIIRYIRYNPLPPSPCCIERRLQEWLQGSSRSSFYPGYKA